MDTMRLEPPEASQKNCENRPTLAPTSAMTWSRNGRCSAYQRSWSPIAGFYVYARDLEPQGLLLRRRLTAPRSCAR